WRDLRFAARVLARDRNFTVVAVLSLALGVGANAAIFSLIDRVLWRQLPIRNPETLVGIAVDQSHATYRLYRDRFGEYLDGVLATTGSVERDLGTDGE